jgi:hypothetical protein
VGEQYIVILLAILMIFGFVTSAKVELHSSSFMTGSVYLLSYDTLDFCVQVGKFGGGMLL